MLAIAAVDKVALVFPNDDIIELSTVPERTTGRAFLRCGPRGNRKCIMVTRSPTRNKWLSPELNSCTCAWSCGRHFLKQIEKKTKGQDKH